MCVINIFEAFPIHEMYIVEGSPRPRHQKSNQSLPKLQKRMSERFISLLFDGLISF